MESFNPFSNSIQTISSSQSASFVTSIPRQPIQKTISGPPPAIDPFCLILPSKPVPTLASPQNTTLSKKKQNHSALAKPGAPLLENPWTIRPLLTSTLPFHISALSMPALEPSPNSTCPTSRPLYPSS